MTKCPDCEKEMKINGTVALQKNDKMNKIKLSNIFFIFIGALYVLFVSNIISTYILYVKYFQTFTDFCILYTCVSVYTNQIGLFLFNSIVFMVLNLLTSFVFCFYTVYYFDKLINRFWRKK